MRRKCILINLFVFYHLISGDVPFDFTLPEIRDSAGCQIVTAIAIFKASPEAVWNAIVDFENYGEFMPLIEDGHLLEEYPDSLIVAISVNIPWPVADIYYEMIIRLDANHRFLRWNHLRGDLEVNSGYWIIEPINDGKIKLTYHVCVKLKTILPDFMVTFAQRILTKNLLGAVAKRAND